MKLHTERLAERDTRIRDLERALGELELDPHQFSGRPCQTCQNVSRALHRSYGCYALQESVVMTRDEKGRFRSVQELI